MSQPAPPESNAAERAMARRQAPDSKRGRRSVERLGRITPAHWLAHRGLRSGLAVRAALSLAGAALLLACGIVMADHAIVDHVFPPYVEGVSHTIITTYSGPWIAGAIGVGMVSGLLLVAAITDLWRRRIIGPDLRTSAPPLAS